MEAADLSAIAGDDVELALGTPCPFHQPDAQDDTLPTRPRRGPRGPCRASHLPRRADVPDVGPGHQADLCHRDGQHAPVRRGAHAVRLPGATPHGEPRPEARPGLAHVALQVVGCRCQGRAIRHVAGLGARALAHRPRRSAAPDAPGPDGRLQPRDRRARRHLRDRDPAALQGQHRVREVAAAGEGQARHDLGRRCRRAGRRTTGRRTRRRSPRRGWTR